MTSATDRPLRVPQQIRDALRSLQGEGHSAWLVGESLRDLALGRSPLPFEAATSLSPEQCLHRHAHAVPTRPAEDTVMLPTALGPLDVTPYRNGKQVESDLPFRDFTIHAMAFDPVAERWLDPFDGRADLARGRLRAVRCAADRLAEDPLRCLRAARICAELGFEADPELRKAMNAAAEGVARLRGMRARWELSRLLRSNGAERGLTLLHETGVLERLVPGTQAAALRGVDALPAELAPRLAWSLRGARPARPLRRLGFGRVTVGRVLHLLQHHPIETGVKTRSETAVRRLLRRLSPEDLVVLERMRSLELDRLPEVEAEPARAELALLHDTISRIHGATSQTSLALGGAEVMRALECAPGPLVGEALDFLRVAVANDPACNDAASLRSLLADWARNRGLA